MLSLFNNAHLPSTRWWLHRSVTSASPPVPRSRGWSWPVWLIRLLARRWQPWLDLVAEPDEVSVLVLDRRNQILAVRVSRGMAWPEGLAAIPGNSAEAWLRGRLAWPAESGRGWAPVVLEQVRTGQPRQIRAQAHTPAGTWIPVLVSARTLELAGGAWVLLVRDARRNRALEAELDQARSQCQVLEAKAIQAERLAGLGQMAAGLAHDMNNVLGAILSQAEGPRARLEPGDPLAGALDAILTACLRGRAVLSGVSRLARADSPALVPVALNTLLEETLALLACSHLKGIEVSLDLDPGSPWVQGDLGTLSHALVNLLVNAADACAHGGRISLQSRVEPGGRALVRVLDTGCGMAPEVLARAQEPFYTTKLAGKGTGQGLARVASTMKAHGGHLQLVSRVGVGTEATLVFPGTVPVQPANPERAEAPLRVLVVDDDPYVREAMKELLEVLGHQVQDLSGGRAAVQAFRDGLEVDLVLLDLNLPDLHGAAALDQILALRPGQRVLLASGSDGLDMAALVATYRSVACIQKPFRLHELREKIRQLKRIPV